MAHSPAAPPSPDRTQTLRGYAALSEADLLKQLGTNRDGLAPGEITARLRRYGRNTAAGAKPRTTLRRLVDNLRNPLVILLTALGVISYVTGDLRGTIMIGVMVALGVVLRFVQEMRSDNAAEKLKALVGTRATAVRGGARLEVRTEELVPGDLILLAAGDIVPADVRLIDAHDLYIDQSTLTGESMPVPKSTTGTVDPQDDAVALPNLCFQGSNVQTGSGTAVVLLTGGATYFGALAESITEDRPTTSFETGINSFTWLIIRFMMVLVPLVFVLNGLSHGSWLEAFLFAMAVAVGLTPEMLPMIVTVNLSKGALAMSRRHVIVKQLDAIQNLGAMDVLCTDKTGTLTQGKIVLVRHVDVDGNDRAEILQYAFLNAFFETGLKNVMDVAILEHAHLKDQLVNAEGYVKVDEIPFDFERRRLSVVVDDASGHRSLICKGAVEEVIAHCSHVMTGGTPIPLDAEHHHPKSEALTQGLSEQGFRVVALACRDLPREDRGYGVADEQEMTLIGFLAFLDPPKETAKSALADLRASGVTVKILTGDNDVVTRTICRQVGLEISGVMLGNELEGLTDEALAGRVESVTVFAKLAPAHKQRVIRALKQRGHVVGFMGDGINDAPALKTGDVGISVDTAVDIARESSDIILLEHSLGALHDGVMEGRRVFGNVVKYIRMAASSSFGNMFSVVGASIFLPFLPMLPIQVLTNNLLYDFSQTTIPTDNVDPQWLRAPRTWAINDIRRFILVIGPISSLFDYATFALMLYAFDGRNNPALFRTGWFVESIFTQTLIIHVIRTNRIPFIESRASVQLTATSILIVAIGAWLPYSPLASALGFTALPALYWPALAGMLVLYVALTQIIKTRYARRYGG